MKTVTITGANTFSEVSNELWTTDALTLVLPNAITNVASWRVFGKAATPVTLTRTGASGTFTLNYTGRNNISTDYTTVSNGVGTPVSTWYMGANSTDGGGNTGFLFSYGAVRYWVGGSGTWDATTTTNWAYLSGYAGGAPAPTSATDVYFDGNSDAGVAFTATLATGNCRYFSIGEFISLDQNMVLAGTDLNVYGSLLFPSAKLSCTYTGSLNFVATTLGNLVTTNGVVVTNAIFSSETGGWTLGSSISATVAFNINACLLFDTAGYNISTVQLLNYITASVRNIYLRNSTISNNGYYRIFLDGALTTVDAGTSTILAGGAGSAFVANNNSTWYNVTIRAFGSTGDIVGNNLTFSTLQFTNISSSSTWAGSITATNLILGSNVTGVKTIYLGANSSFTNITAGTSTNNGRWNIMSSVLGTPRTITSSTVNLQNVDFRDITAAGAIPWTGTNLGDCGGNTNITFTSKTVYWNLAGTQNWNANGWALTSGGTPAVDNFPLPQDTAVFDNAGAATTVTINANYNIGTIDFSARTTAVTLASGTQTPNFYGNLTLSSAVTLTGTGTWTFAGTGVQNITSAGKTYPMPININSGNTFKLVDAMTTTASTTSVLTKGILDLNEKTLTCIGFSAGNSNITRSIKFGTTGFIYVGGNGFYARGDNFTATDSGGGIVFTSGGYYNVYGTSIPSDYYTHPMNITVGPSTSTFTLEWQPSIVKNLIFNSNYTGLVNFRGARILGNLVLAPGMSIQENDSYRGIIFQGTDQTVTTNGVTIRTQIDLGAGLRGAAPIPSGIVPKMTLVDNMVIAFPTTFSVYAIGIFTLNQGTLNLNGKKLTLNQSNITSGFINTGANPRSIQFNGGTIEIQHAGSAAYTMSGSNFSVTGPGTINMTSASAKTFAGGGFNYANVTLNQGGLGDLTITGANTFQRISNTVRPAKIIFPASTTTTLSEFSISGSSEGQVTLASSTPGTRFTISKASGHVAPYNCTISDSSATGGATWRAPANYGNVNGGNNLGWTYSDINIKTNNFFYFADVIHV